VFPQQMQVDWVRVWGNWVLPKSERGWS